MADFSHYRVFKDHQVPEILAAEGMVPEDPMQTLTSNLQIEITKLTEDTIEFDLMGVDASVANALRRILLAEVTTVAVETVWIATNTSIIQDEVLAHRIGLVPLKIDPSKLEDVIDNEETDRDTIVLHYEIECTDEIIIKPDGSQGYKNETAYSGGLTWVPQGNQAEVFPGIFLDILDCIFKY
jgi:DNA-directed RNA polymerase I and III subunit RPAC1